MNTLILFKTKSGLDDEKYLLTDTNLVIYLFIDFSNSFAGDILNNFKDPDLPGQINPLFRGDKMLIIQIILIPGLNSEKDVDQLFTKLKKGTKQ